MILLCSHQQIRTPVGVDDVTKPTVFNIAHTGWLALSEQRWVTSHERRSCEFMKFSS
jgi:hypothetical protein